MKTDNIYFHCKNGKLESGLVKAIEQLPEEDMLILPSNAEMGCMKKDGKIIIYPHNPEQKLCTMEHIITKDYNEYPSYSIFRINDINYKVLHENPFVKYENSAKNERPKGIF